ncbi:MAG: polyphosphate kinase 2, partial [Gammaproteobacteria bacterium]
MIKNEKKRTPAERKPVTGGATSHIREAVSRIVDSLPSDTPVEAARSARLQLKKGETRKVVKGALERHFEKQELMPYQAELIKLQQHIEKMERKIIILFDGRDASGKGGTIRRVTRYLNTRRYRTVALGKPTREQKTELHMKRYIEQFPHAGELVLFDRSWYNRAMVEPVMEFCTQKQYREFM